MTSEMTRFLRANFTSTPEQMIERYVAAGVARAAAEDAVRHIAGAEVWKNNLYQVLIDKAPQHGFGDDIVLWYLSIKRIDKEPIHDWRHIQLIKNELCGPQVEAIELYPAESRVVDSSNQYHIYAVMQPSKFMWPVGMFPQGAMRFTSEEAAKLGAKQRDI